MPDNFIGGFRTLPTGEQATAGYVWDTDLLSWVAQTKTTSSGAPGSEVSITNASLPVTQAGVGINSNLGRDAIYNSVCLVIAS